METENNYICRVCLSSDTKEYKSIFDDYQDSSIYVHINCIADVDIRRDDSMPKNICLSCLLELETAVGFKKKCQDSAVILHTSFLSLELKTDFSFSNQNRELNSKTIIKKEYLSDNDEEDLEDSPVLISNYAKPKIKLNKTDLKLECNECGGIFKSKCKMRVHWKNVHLLQTLVCNRCKRNFKSVQAFNKHKNNKLKSCNTAGSDKVHIEGEGKSRVFHCTDCDYKSMRVKDMRSHIMIHSGERPYTCNICSASYTQISSLDSHKESAHKIYKAEVTCPFCGKFVKGRKNSYRHLKRHTEKQVSCEICKKFFKNKQSLKNHMPRHTGIKNYTCEKCALTFYAMSDLCNHKRLKHSKQPNVNFKCSMCEYTSKRKYCITKHELKHSTGKLPCTVCGMFFDNEQKLNGHQKRHFSEKKYSCPYCELKFMGRGAKSSHIRSKHKISMVGVSKKLKGDDSEILEDNKLNGIIKVEFPIIS